MFLLLLLFNLQMATSVIAMLPLSLLVGSVMLLNVGLHHERYLLANMGIGLPAVAALGATVSIVADILVSLLLAVHR